MKKVLVIRFSSLGDVILASSIIQPLYKRGFSIDFLTFNPFDQLFLKDYRLNKIISLEKKQLKSLKDIKIFSNKLNEYDYILDLHNNFRTRLLSLFSKKTFIRYNKNSIKRRLLTTALGKRLLHLEDFNVLKAYQDTLKNIGINETKIHKPKIILTDKEIENAKNKLPENIIALGAGARYKNKMYPFYPKVAKLLLKEGFNVILVGSKDDRKIDKGMYPKKVIDFRGKLSLRESIAVLKNAVLTISNDSAVAHMSRAVSTPVLMIYGATHPYFGFAPLKEEGDYIFANLDCQPCDLHGKKECKYEKPECLYSISPEIVVKKSLEIIS